jgi:hypothetical protein
MEAEMHSPVRLLGEKILEAGERSRQRLRSQRFSERLVERPLLRPNLPARQVVVVVHKLEGRRVNDADQDFAIHDHPRLKAEQIEQRKNKIAFSWAVHELNVVQTPRCSDGGYCLVHGNPPSRLLRTQYRDLPDLESRSGRRAGIDER